MAEAARYVNLVRVFAEKRGLAEKLARSLSEFEVAAVAARPPRHQMKITNFLLCKLNKYCMFSALSLHFLRVPFLTGKWVISRYFG